MRKMFFRLFVIGAFLNFQAYAIDEPYLKASDIQEIFDKFVRVNYTTEYKNRYSASKFPRHKNTGPWKWEGKDFPRVISLLEFDRFINENQIRPQKALAVEGYYSSTGRDPECHFLPCEQLIFTSYQTNPEKHDLHNLDLEEADFDFVMLNQVLEHTYDPIRCLKNIHRYMKSGGVLYINVPVTNLPHDTPWHYYTGYTPTGLGAVVKAAGFEILQIGQWGNFEYLDYLFKRYSWPDYLSLKNPGLNDIRFPVITWIFAIKPE